LHPLFAIDLQLVKYNLLGHSKPNLKRDLVSSFIVVTSFLFLSLKKAKIVNFIQLKR
jgi:hypothetical protein